MSSHNKRGKAAKAAAKTRRAEQHGRGSRSGGHGSTGHYRGKSHGASYLSTSTNRNINRAHHTYDAMDPLDMQLFDYMIVVDVEATCEANNNSFPHEVIEFPGVLIDVRKGVVDRQRSFHTFVKPVKNPILTNFCTALTGIKQSDVDNAPTIAEAIEKFEQWYRKTIPRGAKVMFASDGPWDFKNFFHQHHVLRDHVSLPTIFYEYVDIRTTFAHQLNNGTPMKLEPMLHRMNLKFQGRPHCGFDDAINIARLAIAMMRVGCVFDFVCAISLDDEHHHKLEGYPVYRREEGSGRLDRDVVDDIAKACFGTDFFTFGESYRGEVKKYREEHSSKFSNSAAKALKRREKRTESQKRLQIMWKYFSFVLLLLAVVGSVLYTLYMRQMAR